MIMHGCNGAMGRVIAGLVAQDDGIRIVAGVDLNSQANGEFPVYSALEEVKEEADVIVDFASAKAVDGLLDYGKAKQIPIVLCTTGLSQEQLEKVEETAKSVAVLRSADRKSVV